MDRFDESKLVSMLEKARYDIRVTSLIAPLEEELHRLFHTDNIRLLFYTKGDGDWYIPQLSSVRNVGCKKSSHWLKRQSLEGKRYVTKATAIEPLLSGKQQNEDFIVVPLYGEDSLTGALIVFISDRVFTSNEIDAFVSLVDSLRPMLCKAIDNERINEEQRRESLLLHVTKKFHSTMDVGSVLSEIVNVIHEMYPEFKVKLILSRDWEVDTNIHVEKLSYDVTAATGTAETAYLTGEIQIEDSVKDKISTLYAPLRGKQGIYGVMSIISPHSVIFLTHEREFIAMLADIGGTAIENAELFRQSRSLIHDLQLINETSHQLNSNLRLVETIKFMTNRMIQSFEAHEVGFILFHKNGEMNVLEGSTEYFFSSMAKDSIQVLAEKIKKEKEPLLIGDLNKSDVPIMGSYLSMLVVPMIQSRELKGMALVLHKKPYHFSFEDFNLFKSLIHHSTLAFTNAMLHEELERLVITDHLTRLYSRNYLDEQVQKSMQHDALGCFIFIDIDDFKKINDSYGHQVGDDILIQVANIMKRNSRGEDVVARWGGEELAIYLPRVEKDVGAKVAKRIVDSVALETSPRVTISCGVSAWTQEDKEKSLNKLFNQADEALYQAKETGKNQVVVYPVFSEKH